jgi:hypothetical protein
MTNCSEFFIKFFSLFSTILTIVISIISIVSAMKGLGKRPIKNIRERYEYYKEIIINKGNKVLAYTGLKEYLGFSIGDGLAEYIIQSTQFYEIVNVLKITQGKYIEFDSTANKIVYKNDKKPKRCLLTISYFIFMLPLIALLTFANKIALLNIKYLFASILLVIPWTILAIFYFGNEIGERSSAINLLKKLENEG